MRMFSPNTDLIDINIIYFFIEVFALVLVLFYLQVYVNLKDYDNQEYLTMM